MIFYGQKKIKVEWKKLQGTWHVVIANEKIPNGTNVKETITLVENPEINIENKETEELVFDFHQFCTKEYKEAKGFEQQIRIATLEFNDPHNFNSVAFCTDLNNKRQSKYVIVNQDPDYNWFMCTNSQGRQFWLMSRDNKKLPNKVLDENIGIIKNNHPDLKIFYDNGHSYYLISQFMY